MIIFFLFIISLNGLSAGDIAKGKITAATCIACHGSKGMAANRLWPNLFGQNQPYLIKQLNDFKSGKRIDPQMSLMAKNLSDEEIQNVSAYFSSLLCKEE